MYSKKARRLVRDKRDGKMDTRKDKNELVVKYEYVKLGQNHLCLTLTQ